MDEKGKVEKWQEPETTILRGIAGGGTGGELTALDSKDGKLVRIRPFRLDTSYTPEQLALSQWEIDINGKKFSTPVKTAPNYFALAYKNRVYSKNRVKYPLKRIDWEPGGDPVKINAKNRGRSKFKRISWDEALDIIEGELRRVLDTYGPYSVLCIGENGHRESKDLHAGGGMQSQLMDKLGGYTRETRTPDSVEGFYWGAKHVWGSGSNKGLGLVAPPDQNFTSWNNVLDVLKHTQLVAFHAGDWEVTQNYASQFWSRLLKYMEELDKEFVVVDPFCNYTAVCHQTMKWIPILPNTDAALDFAIMYTWITEDIYNKEYVETHSVGFDKVKAYILGEEDGIPKTPEWAAPLCGVPEWTIKAYARNAAKKKTSYVHFSSGAIKGPYSHEPGRTEAYKLAMQGLGAPGIQQVYMNASTIGKQFIQKSTSAPFLMATKARMYYPTVQSIPRSMVAHAVQDGEAKWWGSPQIVYVSLEDQFKEYNYPAPKDQGGVECHLFWSEKPCNMACWDGGFNYQDALRNDKVECFITNHQWLENDSLFADLILPVTTCVEEDDTVGGAMVTSAFLAGIQDRAVEPIGESMSDYQIALEVGKRFGVDEEISLGMTVDEWRQYAFEQSQVITEISWEEFKEKGYYVPKMDPSWQDIPAGMRTFYEDPEAHPLDTPTGKLEFYSQALAETFPDDKERQPIAKWLIGGPESEGWTHDETLHGEKAKTYPLLLTANPGKWRIHVQGDDIVWFREIETCKVKGPDGYLYEPVWISHKDAVARGIKNGDIVKVKNDQGIILTGARVTERVAEGALIINKGSRVDPIAPHIDRGGSTNLISPPRQISKHCKGFAVSGYLVEAEKLTQEEYDEWKQKYPDAFARDYDSAVGINYSSWVVEEGR
jgi:trimethylamine-N-oxide reductase (cytochrome c)